jgi:hypothetical protein
MPHGPNHDFTGPITLALHHTPLQQALANLEAHQSARPEYLPRAPYDHPQNEAWRRWARERQDLLDQVTIAKACNGSSVQATKKAKPINSGHVQGYTVAHFVDRINDLLRKMALEPEGSAEWFHLRQLASSARHAAMKRARELRDRSTIIPEIPRKRRTCRMPMPSPTIGVKRNAYFKPLSHFVAKLQGLLDEMTKLDVWTNEWEALRDRACAARSAAQRRAYETGDTTTPIPEVPRRGHRPK